MTAARRQTLHRVLRRPDAERSQHVRSHDTLPPFEVLEHTADIGLRAWGKTREALFENCALGLAEILDRSGNGEVAEGTGRVAVELHATDIEALLVEWMNEVLFALEGEEACLHGSRITEITEAELRAQIELSACAGIPEATELKAATYHQLSILETPRGWEATVYFDV